MDIKNKAYNKYDIVNEIFETISIIKNFENIDIQSISKSILPYSKLMLTGEGSSRIFPAKNIIHHRFMFNHGPYICTEGAQQLQQYLLQDYTVFAASNSGKTKEVIQLFSTLKQSGMSALYAMACNKNTLLEELASGFVFLNDCVENAVAATKSVVAQALIYEKLLQKLIKYDFSFVDLAEKFNYALTYKVDKKAVNALLNANTIYFAGNNNGVAEELTLKTNEILRKKSAYLPGTYLLHGVEEVVNKNDAIVLVDPIKSEFEKIEDLYVNKINVPVISFGNNSPFINISLHDADAFQEGYLKLATGWNLLVEAGINLGINIDKPERARKIGNEYLNNIDS